MNNREMTSSKQCDGSDICMYDFQNPGILRSLRWNKTKDHVLNNYGTSVDVVLKNSCRSGKSVIISTGLLMRSFRE